MQGIHKQAHEQIGEFFGGSPYYPPASTRCSAPRSEKASLTNFFVYTGVIFLSIVCPPLGFAIGVELALHDYSKALERERLFGSMIDPELVLSRAEVEADLFAAKLGLALSFIPERGRDPRARREGDRQAGPRRGHAIDRPVCGEGVRGDLVETIGSDCQANWPRS